MARKLEGYCQRNHELTPENTWVEPGSGRRRCRKCMKASNEAGQARRSAERKRAKARKKMASADNSYELDDLDFAILAALPDEGAKLGKYLPDSRTSVQLHKELDDPVLAVHTLGRRLTSLRDAGYVVAAGSRATKSAKGWQRTEKGKAVV